MCKKIGQNLSCSTWKMALRIIEERTKLYPRMSHFLRGYHGHVIPLYN